MSQEELLVLIYKKDEKAFTHLYDMYSKSLFSVINVLIRNREEAEDVLQEVAVNLPITKGARRLISTLKANGFKTAILSGGFQYFAEYLQAKLGIDEVHANILDVQDGLVTGEVKGAIVDGARKAELLRQLADKMGISLEQAMAVGDGAGSGGSLRRGTA